MNKRELREWYKACDFIKKEMQFYSFLDFLENADNIKYYFENSNSYIRQLYQWYVFSNVNVSNKHKSLIWDYITDNLMFNDYIHLEHRTILKNKKDCDTIKEVSD